MDAWKGHRSPAPTPAPALSQPAPPAPGLPQASAPPALVRDQLRQRFEKNIRHYLTNGCMYCRYRYSQERVESFRETVRLAHAQGVELYIAVNPVHVLQLETVRSAGLWEIFEDWKRDLARVLSEENALAGRNAPFWDFSGYSSYPSEPLPTADAPGTLHYYRESSHFTPALGEEVLARMLTGGGNPEFGVLLTPENLEPHLARIRQERQRWASRNDSEVQWVTQIARDYGYAPPEMVASQPGGALRK